MSKLRNILVALVLIVTSLTAQTGPIGAQESLTRLLKADGWLHAFGLANGSTAPVRLMGRFDDVKTVLIPIWDAGTAYTRLTVATPMHISSSAVLDSVVIAIDILDVNWDQRTVLITLAGRTETTVIDDINGDPLPVMRVLFATNISNDTLAGDVYIYEDDTVVAGVPQTESKLKAKIVAAGGQTHMAMYTIPRGFTGFVAFLTGGIEGKNDIGGSVQAWATAFPGYPLQFVAAAAMHSNAGEIIMEPGVVPQGLSEMQDLELRAFTTDGSGATVSIRAAIILVPNSELP